MSDESQKRTDEQARLASIREDGRERFSCHCALEAPSFAAFATDMTKAYAKELLTPNSISLETFPVQVWQMVDGRKVATPYIVLAKDLDEAEWAALTKHRLVYALPDYGSIWTDRGNKGAKP